MPTPRRWTRDELLVLLNIYEKVPFGQFDQDQRVMQDIAKKMNRTPGSVAMKLCNLASLDPVVLARGRKGLPGASNLDRAVWKEFYENRDTLVPVSEEMFRSLFAAKEGDELELVKGVGVKKQKAPIAFSGPTETKTTVTARRGQQFFRQMILNSFDNRCAISGIGLRELLVASHILPWNSHPAERLHPQNGLSLSRLHDGAFDRGLITFDDDLRLVLGKDLRAAVTNTTLKQSFADFEGQCLAVPIESQSPIKEFMAYHREIIFRG